MSNPKYSVATWMTPKNTILEDIAQVAATGADGIGLWEGKFGDTAFAAIQSALTEHRLRATFCMPALWTILPGPVDGPAERDPAERTRRIRDSIARLAAFDPVAIVVGPGTSGDAAHPAGPIEVVASSLRQIADTAAEYGQRVAFELLATRRGCPIRSVREMVQFLDGVGRDNVGISFDVWHSWADPGLHSDLEQYAGRIDNVQVNDVRYDERSWADRVFPGDGRGVAADIIAALICGGYRGWYELEVISDDGRYGTTLPDSLWALPHEELLRRGRRAFDTVYAEAEQIAAARTAQP